MSSLKQALHSIIRRLDRRTLLPQLLGDSARLSLCKLRWSCAIASLRFKVFFSRLVKLAGEKARLEVSCKQNIPFSYEASWQGLALNP